MGANVSANTNIAARKYNSPVTGRPFIALFTAETENINNGMISGRINRACNIPLLLTPIVKPPAMAPIKDSTGVPNNNV